MAEEQDKLVVSCGLGRLRAAKEAIAAGADVNAYGKNTNGVMNTPLFAAAFTGQLRIAAFLIEAGADVNKPGIEAIGNLPLTGAAGFNYYHTVQLLLDKGADIHACNKLGWNALFFAAGRGGEETIALLLDRGANINAVTSTNNQTALHNAAGGGHVKAIQLLLSRGADTTIVCKFSTDSNVQGEGTALEVARTMKKDAVVAELETPTPYVASVPQTREALQETFTSACQNDANEALVNRMLDEGLSLTEGRRGGRVTEQTPLHWACITGNTKIIEALVERGADPNIDVHGADPPLFRAISNGHLRAAQLLLRLGSNPYFVCWKYMLLHYAVIRRQKDCVELALNYMDINTRFPRASGFTALHCIAAETAGQTTEAMVKFLLERGADRTAICMPTTDLCMGKEVYGTPEEVAIMVGRMETAKLLREWGKPSEVCTPAEDPLVALKTENDSLRAELLALRNAVGQKEATIQAEAQNTARTLNATIDGLKKQVATLTAALEASEKERASLKAEKEELLAITAQRQAKP